MAKDPQSDISKDQTVRRQRLETPTRFDGLAIRYSGEAMTKAGFCGSVASCS